MSIITTYVENCDNPIEIKYNKPISVEKSVRIYGLDRKSVV